ncbi:unnamed protein product [Euphydryas editha]|uniref:Uncharacterized protein n=1 Tax=Euphydryas editha TaxID=104508 RepID=A0AAU9V0T5_EUPED|nr:unnamed protein product [Euphydryas editha]
MLLFHGVPEEKTKDPPARVTAIVAEHLKLDKFFSISIKTSYQLGCLSGKSRARHDAFLVARESFGINKCLTQGTIYVITSEGTRHRAESIADLDEISGSGSTEKAK